MKKLFWIACLVVSILIGTAFFLPYIKKINSLPNDMVVTYSDIEQVNADDEFSKFINLDVPKNLTVSSDDDFVKTTLSVKLFNIFTLRKIDVKLIVDTDVFVGGDTVGFNLFGEGVVCVGSNAIVTENGTIEPLKDSEINEGDTILKIEESEINSIDDIDRIINLPIYAGKELTLTIKRDDEILTQKITPVFDLLSQKYKLGLWVKNSASGVGTLTYVKKSNFRFGAVGHPIVDTSLPNFDVESGNIYKCKLLGIKKGQKNDPGEIRSSIDLSDDAIGFADTNCKFGVFGNIYNKTFIEANRSSYLGGRLGVKLGDAKIYCAIDSEGVKAYDVKIIKANKQDSADDKSMIVKVTDKDLLNKTGGIIQGMSGSPIVQNGKIVGAITHVFVNDPTRGYGVYIDWMIDN